MRGTTVAYAGSGSSARSVQVLSTAQRALTGPQRSQDSAGGGCRGAVFELGRTRARNARVLVDRGIARTSCPAGRAAGRVQRVCVLVQQQQVPQNIMAC